MGRKAKTSLSWFKKDVGFYRDIKIEDLMFEYGPTGVTIYDIILTKIYAEGYYLKVPSMNHLVHSIIKDIGNRWIKNKGFVLQVVHYCAEIGLFDQDLLEQNVITSVGIQKRYQDVTARNKVQKNEYWLLDKNKEEDEQPLLSAPNFNFSATEKAISATEKAISATEKPLRKEKNKNIYIYYESKALNEVFCLYLNNRNEKGERLTICQIDALKDTLDSLSEDESERIEIVKRAIAAGWKSFYPLSKRKQTQTVSKQKHVNDHTFSGNRTEYDYQALEDFYIQKMNGMETDTDKIYR